jgi:CIC family chloride channel protein
MGAMQNDDSRRLGLFYLTTLALALGLLTGFGAFLFRDLIGLLHNLFFTGRFMLPYDANEFTASNRWGAFVILVPVIGAVIVTFLVSNFAPEAKGHGVPEVMDAIYYRGGVIRPIVAVVKSLASAVAIGSGSSVGREGPIIQIGSALGSTVGQIVRMPPGQRIALVAAGAGAGIAATFNTPIGGVMFAIELMMPEVSVSTFLPVAVATGAATFLGRVLFGQQPAFLVPPMEPLTADANAVVLLLLYSALGAVTGVAAAGFIHGLNLAEDAFDKIPWRYLRHMLGMLLVGLMMYVLYRAFGQYYVDGVGYATIEHILAGQMSSVWLLGLLCVCKALATSSSLGSGSSGGIFSPSLFMGATLGGSFAALLSALGFPIPLSIPVFAMVGMGAMVGGGTGAVMTAVTMTFEMTRDYDIVMPMILAVAATSSIRCGENMRLLRALCRLITRMHVAAREVLACVSNGHHAILILFHLAPHRLVVLHELVLRDGAIMVGIHRLRAEFHVSIRKILAGLVDRNRFLASLRHTAPHGLAVVHVLVLGYHAIVIGIHLVDVEVHIAVRELGRIRRECDCGAHQSGHCEK